MDAVKNSFKWFSLKQNEDGSWGDKNKTGNTSLVLINFFSRSYNHMSKSYGPCIKEAMKWLVMERQDEILSPTQQALKTLALAEAWNVSDISDVETALKRSVKKLLKLQSQKEFSDYHFFSWNMQGLIAAYHTGVFEKSLLEVVNKNILWLKNELKKTPPKELETQVVLSTWKQLFFERQSAVIVSSENVKLEDQKLIDWYHIFNSKFNEPKSWKEWNGVLKKVVLANQQEDGSCLYKNQQDIDLLVKNTALCTLMLQIYYTPFLK